MMIMGVGLTVYQAEADSYGFAMRDAKEKVAIAMKRMNLGLYRGDWAWADTYSQEILSLADWVSQDQLDMARYVRIGALLRHPDVETLGQAHDLALAIQQSPELKGFAQAQVVVAMDTLGVKPELLAFVADQARDYLTYMHDDLSMTGHRQARLLDTLVSLRLLVTSERENVREYAARLPFGEPEQAVYFVRKALFGVISDHRTRTRLARRQLPDRTVSVLMAEALFSEANLLQQLHGKVAHRSVISGLDRLLQRHILALRSWQQPHRLLSTIAAWQERAVMPDSGRVDHALITLIGCDRQEDRESMASFLPPGCQSPILGYLQPVFSDPIFRTGIHNYHALSVNLTRLEAILAESEALADQEILNQEAWLFEESGDDAGSQLVMLPALPEALAYWFGQHANAGGDIANWAIDNQSTGQIAAVPAYHVPREITVKQLREAGWLLHRLLDHLRVRQQSHLLSMLMRQLAHERQRLEGYRERLALP